MSNESSNQDWVSLQIGGMTCASCELILERKIKKVPGVEKVHVNCKTGVAGIKLDPSNKASLAEIQTAIEEAG